MPILLVYRRYIPRPLFLFDFFLNITQVCIFDSELFMRQMRFIRSFIKKTNQFWRMKFLIRRRCLIQVAGVLNHEKGLSCWIIAGKKPSQEAGYKGGDNINKSIFQKVYCAWNRLFVVSTLLVSEDTKAKRHLRDKPVVT